MIKEAVRGADGVALADIHHAVECVGDYRDGELGALKLEVGA